MPTADQLLGPAPNAAAILTKSTAAERLGKLAKSEEEVSIDGGASGSDLPDGSFERAIQLVRTPSVRAVPCPGGDYGDTVDGNFHYPSVYGTYADHTIVGCDGCDRFWKVPYTIENSDGRANVMVGTPEPRVRAYLAPNAAVDAVNDPPFQPDEVDSPVNDAVPITAPDGLATE